LKIKTVGAVGSEQTGSGIVEVAALIGLDTMLHISELMFGDFKHPKYSDPVLLGRKLPAGHLGRKTGTGFFGARSGDSPHEL
jgi:3-hydroxybutyryl-CoA dehydrogenase